MNLNPRYATVAKAKNVISDFACKIWEHDGLTALEMVSIFVQLAHEFMKYPMREERHPYDATKKADEA